MDMKHVGPGWYLDEHDPSLERYWNGGSWMEHTRQATAGAEYAGSDFAEIDPDLVDFETTMLFLAREQLVAARKTSNYVAQLFWLQAGLLLLGVVAFLAGILIVALR